MATRGALVVGFYGQHLAHGLQTSDVSAPAFSAGPSVDVITPTSVRVSATVTDATPPITFYLVAVADAASAPSAAQVKAGTDALDASAPNGNATATNSGDSVVVNVGGLSETTAYDLYYVATDGSANDSTPAKLDVTTITSPAASGTPTIGAIARRFRRL